MRVCSQWLPIMLLLTGCAFTEEVEITVFTLKDGRQVEAISFASATQEGESVHSVTTTTGQRMVLWGHEVIRKENVKKEVSELPEYARKKLAEQEKVRQEWSVRAAAEREAEELKRRTAFVRAAEMAEEGKALREAELAERTVRQRCAALWDAQQSAVRRIQAAQNAIARAHENYRDAVEDLRSVDHWRARTPEETARRQFLRQRAQRQVDSAQDDIREGERLLQYATQQANQYAAQLAREKTALAEAEQRVAEARSRYEEARQRFKQPVPPPEAPPVEENRPGEAVEKLLRPGNDAPVIAPAARSTVARVIGKGEFIQLADGSLWEIHPQDRLASERWQPEQEVTIAAGADPKYAHRLINGATKMAVKAQKLK